MLDAADASSGPRSPQATVLVHQVVKASRLQTKMPRIVHIQKLNHLQEQVSIPGLHHAYTVYIYIYRARTHARWFKRFLSALEGQALMCEGFETSLVAVSSRRKSKTCERDETVSFVVNKMDALATVVNGKLYRDLRKH